MIVFGDFGIDRRGRLHCSMCGSFLTFQLSDYPEGPNGESIFVPEYGCPVGLLGGEKILKYDKIWGIQSSIECTTDFPFAVKDMLAQIDRCLTFPEVQKAIVNLNRVSHQGTNEET